MENRRKHYFPANDCTVVTGMCPNGEYGAYREDEDEGLIRGYGHSRYAAIADLVEAISQTEEEEAELRTFARPDKLDAINAAWDHARDLRKHSEPL